MGSFRSNSQRSVDICIYGCASFGGGVSSGRWWCMGVDGKNRFRIIALGFVLFLGYRERYKLTCLCGLPSLIFISTLYSGL